MIKLFSGSANQELSQQVADLVKLPLAKAEIIRFDNSEVRVTIKENVKSKTCVIIQPTANPTDTHLIELLFFADALKRQEAKQVIGYLPYFGYARQNIQHRQGECVSANVIIRFLESIGFNKIYTIDLHDEATAGVFSIPYKNLTAMPILAQEIKRYLKINISPTNITIVSPDQGGVERARNFGISLFENSNFHLAVIEKKRNLGIIHHSKALDLYGDIAGKTALLVDDIVTSGRTLINASKLCLKKGAKKVLAAIVHHDFSNTTPELIQESPIEKFFTTNTIHLNPKQNFPKLEEISVAPLIAQELKNLI